MVNHVCEVIYSVLMCNPGRFFQKKKKASTTDVQLHHNPSWRFSVCSHQPDRLRRESTPVLTLSPLREMEGSLLRWTEREKCVFWVFFSVGVCV